MIRSLRKPLRALCLVALLFAPLPLAADAGVAQAGKAFSERYTVYEDAEAVPAITFKHKTEGLIRDLSLQAFVGRVVVLNFWATWCPPCVAEMPSLDRLQAAMGEEGVTVIALSEDRGGFDQVDPFYEEQGLTNLERYVDVGGELARHFQVGVMPTTVLIGPDGVPVGAVAGAAEWDSPEAKKLLRALGGD